MSNLSVAASNLIRKLESIRFEFAKQENQSSITQKQTARVVNEIEDQKAFDNADRVEFDDYESAETTNAQVEILTKENKDLKNRCDKLFSQLRSRDSANTNLNEKIKQLNANLETLQKEKDQAAMEAKSGEAMRMDNLMKSVKSESDSLRNAVTKVQELHITLTEQTNLLKQDLDEANDLNIELNTKMVALRECNEELLQKVDSGVQELSKAKISVTELTSEIATLKSSVSDKSAIIERMITKHRELRHQMDQERQLTTALKVNLATAEDAAADSAVQLAKTWKGQTELVNRHDGVVKDLQRTIQDLQARITVAQAVQVPDDTDDTSTSAALVAVGATSHAADSKSKNSTLEAGEILRESRTSQDDFEEAASSAGGSGTSAPVAETALVLARSSVVSAAAAIRQHDTPGDTQHQMVPSTASRAMSPPAAATGATRPLSSAPATSVSVSVAGSSFGGNSFKRMRLMMSNTAATTTSSAANRGGNLQSFVQQQQQSPSRPIFSGSGSQVPRALPPPPAPPLPAEPVVAPVPPGCCGSCRAAAYGLMVKCGGCGTGFHSSCMRKVLAARETRTSESVKGMFYCDACSGSG